MQIVTAELKRAASIRGKGENKLLVALIFEPNTVMAGKVAPCSGLCSKPGTVLLRSARISLKGIKGITGVMDRDTK